MARGEPGPGARRPHCDGIALWEPADLAALALLCSSHELCEVLGELFGKVTLCLGAPLLSL